VTVTERSSPVSREGERAARTSIRFLWWVPLSIVVSYWRAGFYPRPGRSGRCCLSLWYWPHHSVSGLITACGLCDWDRAAAGSASLSTHTELPPGS